MDLDELSIELRSRDSNEAIDLGVAAGRRFWTAIIGPWLVLVGAIFGLTTIAAAYAPTMAATGLFAAIPWVLKPAFDRIPLFVISRSVFGDVPSFRRTIRHTLERWTSMTVVFDCTVRRLSPYRSLTMPIRELERPDSNQYGERKEALMRRNVRWPAVSLMGVGAAAEQVVAIGAIVAIGMFLPTGIESGISYDLSQIAQSAQAPTWSIVTSMAVYFVAVTLVEVFYVAGGFGLYINRRVELEGWDVELAFRRMARRLTSEKSRRAAGLLLAGGLAAGMICLAGPPAASAAPPDDPQAKIETILESPEFGHSEKQWTWVPREPEEPKAPEESSWSSTLAALGGLLEILLWVAAGAGVGAFAYLLVRQVGGRQVEVSLETTDSTPEPSVEQLAESDETTEMRLPPDLVGSASKRWEKGAHLESLSLLYRGTIEGLAERYAIDIAPHMTAMECRRRVEQAGGPGQFVSRLAEAWTSAAYAGRLPSREAVEVLFADWRRYFGGGER